ncbi:MAG TPA: guanylate kinase, partial [Chloroflexi bacterium]|nr:guanylate kinase [Chloroflexota bacterium]
ENDQELVRRLTSRNTETPEELRVRIETARQEMARSAEFDYKVVNREGCMEEAVDVILAIIKAEHHAVNQRNVKL